MSIVTAVDGEDVPDRVAAVGHELATQFDERLFVLHVATDGALEQGEERPRSEDEGEAGDGTGDEGAGIDLEGDPAAAAVARDVLEGTVDGRSTVTCCGRVGDPVEEILEEARRQEGRYVVVGGRKTSAVGKAIFGSTTQALLLNSDRPVVTVPEDVTQTDGDGPVVAAVDRSDRAERVVREGRELAAATGRELHVVHVLSDRDFIDLQPRSADDLDDGVPMDEARSAAAEIAGKTAAAVTDEVTEVGLVGKPSKRIIEYAHAQDAGYVVTAGRKRSPVGKVLFGSVTQSVILKTACPVLTVMSES